MLKTATPAAEEIVKAVTAQLSWDSRVDATDIRVDAEENTVVLEGSVPSQAERLYAETDALSVPGVMRVENRLHAGNAPRRSASGR